MLGMVVREFLMALENPVVQQVLLVGFRFDSLAIEDSRANHRTNPRIPNTMRQMATM